MARRPPAIATALLALWRLSRPEVWLVSVLPMYLGWLLASRELVPGLSILTAFLDGAVADGATWNEFVAMLTAWLAAAGPFLLAALLLGPVVWIPTLLWNDVHDLAGDRRNPRKARSPLVQGVVTSRWASGVAYLMAGVALLGATAVSLRFAGMVALILVLAWLYSVPPVRLKTRPGADLAVNALGIGLVAGVAGWSIVAPVRDFPFLFAPQGLLVAAAIYVPTTLVDHDADKRAGYLTLATHLGPRRAYRIGWWSWVLCNAGALALSATDTYIPRAMLPLLVAFTPLLVWQYHAFIGKADPGPDMVKGVFLCGFTFLAVNAIFALMYTGLWAT